ncbi:hypothetical protein EBT16_12720 [bacterium]|nr:hypothetical protein [bacterium]
MKFHSFLALCFSVSLTCHALDIPDTKEAEKRASHLKKFLQSEKADYDSRETQKKTLLESLDDLNAKQNKVRERLQALTSHQQEMEMSLENLALEYQNQKKLEQAQRQRLFLLLKVVYKIQKEGMSRFVFYGQNLSQLAGRIRVLLYTLRSHAQLTRQFQERTQKLAEAEMKLKATKLKLSSLSDELKDQQLLLSHLLKNKNKLVARINEKQSSYRLASKEYQRISNQLSRLFQELPSAKKTTDKGLFEPK